MPTDSDPYCWSDNEILGAVYYHWYAADFYREAVGRSLPYYLNTASVGISECDVDYCWFDLDTDDAAEARAWSETSALGGAYYRELISTCETEKFFEFERVWEEHPTDRILHRAHRSSYLDRSMFNRMYPTDIIGKYMVRPIDAAGAREVVEYMWANQMIEFGRPLTSRTTAGDGTYYCTILYAELHGGDWGICDEVHLREAVVAVDSQTGEITFDVVHLRTIEGRCYD